MSRPPAGPLLPGERVVANVPAEAARFQFLGLRFELIRLVRKRRLTLWVAAGVTAVLVPFGLELALMPLSRVVGAAGTRRAISSANRSRSCANKALTKPPTQ